MSPHRWLFASFCMVMVAACVAVNRDPDLIPQNEKSPLDHLGPIRAGKEVGKTKANARVVVS